MLATEPKNLGLFNKDEARSKNIRLRNSLYDRIVKYGIDEGFSPLSYDVDDIVSMLADFWEKNHSKRK